MKPSIKRLKTRNKNRLGADELNAYRSAYEKPLSKKDYLFYIGSPAFVLGGFLFYLTYTWYLTLIFALLGAFYGWLVLLPKSVLRSYQILAFNERNRMLNLLTQQATDSTKIPKEILNRVTDRLSGELKQDFMPITSKIANGATKTEIKGMFEIVKQKYSEDIIFCQYLDQLETNFVTGIDNLEALKDMTVYHNDLREKRDIFLRYKTNRLKDCQILIGFILILISALEFSYGHSRYVEAFANTWIGKIDSMLYVLLLALIMRSFFKYFFDDSITEVAK